ncbi:hypothetical protein HOY80DRAFT_957139 [Tuber brumale]|nr:hypothetical protein HOY80DRAFT_957139 [Tuber brumale]
MLTIPISSLQASLMDSVKTVLLLLMLLLLCCWCCRSFDGWPRRCRYCYCSWILDGGRYPAAMLTIIFYFVIIIIIIHFTHHTFTRTHRHLPPHTITSCPHLCLIQGIGACTSISALANIPSRHLQGYLWRATSLSLSFISFSSETHRAYSNPSLSQ